MTNEEIVTLLNHDLSGEIEAILVYMRDSFVTEDCKPSREMEEIAKDEMRHAEDLAELIVELGGVPTMEHRPLNFGGNTLKGYLARLVTLEKEAIAQYKEHIAEIPNENIKKVLTHILHEEEDHLEEFEELLASVQ
ncbi:MAG: ferritin-like domain-containing protein [Dissulfurispiraceae bacterium]|jgi:bacterioferritin|nr:ferritin-like domain-containing protein [Dissulfurispiraceae bacterium]